ncbi:MAG TPA: hypothetical protein VD997_12455 [Phycisphaerales bacterium]|nr:hypothetical protein [Phycisphaerales bacterium]
MTTTETHAALRRLHRFYEGVLNIDERFERTNFVIDPATRRPVFPASPGVLEAEQLTIHIPEDEPGALHAAGAPVELDPLRDPACDRYLFYFGKPRWSRFAALNLEHIKSVDLVVDADELVRNPLAGAEPALCRWANQHPDLLVSACQKRANVTPTKPRLVGVDPYGLDIRAEFGPVRVEFDELHEDEASWRRTLEVFA